LKRLKLELVKLYCSRNFALTPNPYKVQNCRQEDLCNSAYKSVVCLLKII